MTSFKRKLYDRAHRKGFYQPKRDRDGNLVLKYGRHATLAQFAMPAEQDDDQLDTFNIKREG